jgi:hypothetical protein
VFLPRVIRSGTLRPSKLHFVANSKTTQNNCSSSIMASVVRPAILRQTCLAAASKRTFTTKASSFLTINKFVSSVISKQARSPFVKDLPSSIRVAAFHASERRSILPPLPRELPLPSNDYPIANSLPETIDGTGKTRLA